MKRAPSTNYAFAIGKIRALEKFLIPQPVFEEAIESNMDEALRLFVEADLYSEELLHVKNSEDLEKVLNQELLKVKSLVKNLLLDRELVHLLDTNNLRGMQEISKKFPSEFLQDYLSHLIDMHNIKTFLRLYILKDSSELLEKYLVYGGFIKKEDFLKLYLEDLSFFLNRLEYVHKHSQVIDYASFLREPVERLKKENSFLSLERAINDFLIQALKPAKYITFGPEPLLAYYLAKVNEINLIRMIILGKLNNFQEQLLKERLNLVYA